MVSGVYSGLCSPGVANVATYTSRVNMETVNMDTQLIGIDLAQLMLKHNTRTEKQRPVKAAEPAAESAIVRKETRTESR
jgi:hypothetical protein